MCVMYLRCGEMEDGRMKPSRVKCRFINTVFRLGLSDMTDLNGEARMWYMMWMLDVIAGVEEDGV